MAPSHRQVGLWSRPDLEPRLPFAAGAAARGSRLLGCNLRSWGPAAWLYAEGNEHERGLCAAQGPGFRSQLHLSSVALSPGAACLLICE